MSQGYIYLAKIFPNESIFKIGWAQNPVERIHRLRNSAAPTIRLVAQWPATRADEEALHKYFARDWKPEGFGFWNIANEVYGCSGAEGILLEDFAKEQLSLAIEHIERSR